MPGCPIAWMRDSGETVRPFRLVASTPAGPRTFELTVHRLSGPGPSFPVLIYEVRPASADEPPEPAADRACAVRPVALPLPDPAPEPPAAATEDALAAGLTPREVEILMLLAEGHRTREIASDLCISPITVRNHVQNILAKLGARSRLEAVAMALRNRWFEPS